MYAVTLDPPAVAHQRTELDLMKGPILVDQKGIDWGDGAISAFMANEQRWGSVAVGYRVPNRTITIPMLVSDDAEGSFDDYSRFLRQKVALIQREGGWLLRDAGNGPLYADIQTATLRFPDTWGEAGGIEPNVDLVLECLPDFYGDEIELDPIVAHGDVEAVLTESGFPAVIAGDHPARAQIKVSGTAADQYGVLWAFRSRHYAPDSGNALIWSHNSLTPAVGATSGAESSSRDGNIWRRTVGGDGNWTDVASFWGTHIGTYQVWARIFVTGGGTVARARWSIGDLSNPIYNSRIGLISGGYRMVNLGQVRLDGYPVGGQSWNLTIQGSGGGDVLLDAIYLQPLDESSGRAVGVQARGNPAVMSGRDLLLRYDTIIRETALADTYTPVQNGGDLPRLPPSGLEERRVEALIKVSRGDLGGVADTARDDFTATVSYRPTYLFRP